MVDKSSTLIKLLSHVLPLGVPKLGAETSKIASILKSSSVKGLAEAPGVFNEGMQGLSSFVFDDGRTYDFSWDGVRNRLSLLDLIARTGGGHLCGIGVLMIGSPLIMASLGVFHSGDLIVPDKSTKLI